MSVGEICWIQLDVSQLDHFLYLSREAAEALVTLLFGVRNHVIRTNGTMVGRLLKILISNVLKTDRPYDRYLVSNYIVSYLYQLMNFAETSGARVTLDIAKACEYIHNNLHEELTLDEVAAVSCLCVSQFKQKFKSQIGISPRNYINQQKIDRIKRTLTPASNLTQISNDYGFCNSSYFSSVFKKYTSQTPSDYIKAL